MNDIIKIDNALPDDLDLEYKRNIFNCGWFIAKDIYDEQFKDNPGVVDDKNTFRTMQFTHLILNKSIKPTPMSPAYDVVYKSLKVMVQKCGFEVDEVLRLKFNLLTPHPRYREGQYNVPHIDDTKWGLQDNQWNLIYYPEDTDGDTIFFNEKFEGKFVKDRKLTIRERVEPKNNTAVMFKGNIFHTSSNPIHSDWRIVLNANFTVMPRAELGK